VNDYIRKPLAMDRLIESVERLLKYPTVRFPKPGPNCGIFAAAFAALPTCVGCDGKSAR
jgi:hypothetical protein